MQYFDPYRNVRDRVHAEAGSSKGKLRDASEHLFTPENNTVSSLSTGDSSFSRFFKWAKNSVSKAPTNTPQTSPLAHKSRANEMFEMSRQINAIPDESWPDLEDSVVIQTDPASALKASNITKRAGYRLDAVNTQRADPFSPSVEMVQVVQPDLDVVTGAKTDLTTKWLNSLLHDKLQAPNIPNSTPPSLIDDSASVISSSETSLHTFEDLNPWF